MGSLDQIKKTIQILGDLIQLARGACESARDCLNKYALDRDHIHFLGTIVDRAAQSTQLQDQIGTVDLENLGVISF